MAKHAEVPTSPSVLRCAAYTRKSTAKGLEQEFNSLDAQREACQAYIERQPGWVLVPTRYDDGGFSGANIERPAFQQLLVDAEAGKLDMIVVYKIDRLSRSLLDFVKVMERLQRCKVSFASITQNFSTADAMGRLMLNVIMSFAEFEREMIGERIRDKLGAARRKGKWTGGRVPLGYVVQDKHLFVAELERSAVSEAFELFLLHQDLIQVADLLNERNAPGPNRDSPTERWTKVALLRTLRNPLYAGLISCHGELFPGEHAGIVDRAAFEHVQGILDARQLERVCHGHNDDYLLTGLLRCGLCGSTMVPASTRKGDREYRYYRCSERNKNGREACSAPSLSAIIVEDHVATVVAGHCGNEELRASAKAELTVRRQERQRELNAERSGLPGRIAAARAKAQRYLETAAGAGGKARELAQARLDAASESLAVLEQRLIEVERAVAALARGEVESAWVDQTMSDFHKVWQLLTPRNQGRLLRALLDGVVVDETRACIEVRFADLARPGSHEAA